MSSYVRAYEGSEPYLFVSYAHKDSELVLPKIQELYSRKYRVWYDEGIAPGSEWPQNIARHLSSADVVLVFVSKYSLDSPNCNNEVSVAVSLKKNIIQISLDSVSKHPLLKDTPTLNYQEDLIDELIDKGLLNDQLIGDGVSGYQYAIGRKKAFNIWNLLLGFAAVLAVAFSISLYGLYNGWFDNLLPAKQQTVIASAAPTATREETVSIGNNIIGSVLPVKFQSDEEKEAVYQLLGWTQDSEMTYNDLMGLEHITHLGLSSEPVTDLSFAIYLPNLEVITLSGSQVSDLSPLVNCPKLQKVQVTADMLPLTLPEVWDFQIEVI